MSDKQETIADIIAEKRRQADKIERNCAEMMKRGEMISDCYARELVADIRREADRLEAAHRRELAAGGDAAALREALQAFAEWFDHDGSEDGYGDIRDKARAALSAPPRNCERFATADDAKREFNYLWNFVWQRGGGCLAERNYEEEFERWLFAHATEKEGGAE